jgi:hypothetical protein
MTRIKDAQYTLSEAVAEAKQIEHEAQQLEYELNLLERDSTHKSCHF